MGTATATEDQITQIRRRAVNDVTREIMEKGIKLTWEQADDLGDEALDWMRARLGLRSSTSDRGVAFAPSTESRFYGGGRARYYIRVKTAPHEQWTMPAGWSWDDLKDAKHGAREADAQWMAVELIDGESGKQVRY